MRGLQSRDRSHRNLEEDVSVDINHNDEEMFVPSELEVDYDKNITRLYYAICQSHWDDALEAVTQNPQEAMTWVVRYHPDKKKKDPKVVKLRFLPLHSACARDPPPELIAALLNAYPGGVQCEDDRGMIPLHYSCANQASREILRLLLVAHSPAAKVPDPKGMLAVHYVACWGPSSVSVIDMLVVANRDGLHVKDYSGKTPLDLAMEGTYDTKDEVVTALKRWSYFGEVKESPSPSSTRKSSPKPSPTSVVVKSLAHHQVQSPSLKRSTKAPTRHRPPSHTVAVVERSQLVFPEELEADFFSTKQPYKELMSYQGGSEEKSELVHIDPSDSSTHEDDADGGSIAEGTKHTAHDELLVAQLRADLARVKANKSFNLVDSHGVSDEIKCYQRTINLLHEDLAHAHQETVDVMTKKLEKERKLEKKQMDCYGTDSKLRDMTKLRDRYKDRVESMRVQMATLSSSVNTLLKSQDALISSVNPRDTSRRRRKEKLEELLEAEEESADDRQGAFEKQAREMKAIAAIIKKSKASNA